MVTAADRRAPSRFALAALRPYTALDWTAPVGDPEWSCRQTLHHTSGR